MAMFPHFPTGNAELTGDNLQDLIRMASRQITSQSPIVPLQMPDGVCFTIDPTALKELLAGDTAESQDDLDNIFSPSLDESEVAAIADQRVGMNGFDWIAATVDSYDGVNYTLLSQNVNNDGTFSTPSLGDQQTYTAQEFSGNPGVPLGASVWAFALPDSLTTNVYYFFCPELTQIVRITDDAPNPSGLYQGVIQRFSQPPGTSPSTDDSVDSSPQLTGQFQDQEQIWITTNGSSPPSGTWMLGRHVGQFDDGLKIFAVTNGSSSCCNACDSVGAIVYVPPVSITSDCRVKIPTSRIGIANKQVVYIRESYQTFDDCNNETDELCLCPVPKTPVVIYTTTGQVLGTELVLPKAILTMVNDVLVATPSGTDSVNVGCCAATPSSSSSSSSSVPVGPCGCQGTPTFYARINNVLFKAGYGGNPCAPVYQDSQPCNLINGTFTLARFDDGSVPGFCIWKAQISLAPFEASAVLTLIYSATRSWQVSTQWGFSITNTNTGFPFDFAYYNIPDGTFNCNGLNNMAFQFGPRENDCSGQSEVLCRYPDNVLIGVSP